jgi:hypothetical protein
MKMEFNRVIKTPLFVYKYSEFGKALKWAKGASLPKNSLSIVSPVDAARIVALASANEAAAHVIDNLRDLPEDDDFDYEGEVEIPLIRLNKSIDRTSIAAVVCSVTTKIHGVIFEPEADQEFAVGGFSCSFDELGYDPKKGVQ